MQSNAATAKQLSWQNNRLVQLLIALLAIQLVLVGILYFPKGKTAPAGVPLLGDTTSDSITTINVTDANGKTISLQKQGDDWVLPDADNYPADPQNIQKALDSLTAVTTDRLVTKTEASQKKLEVATDKFQRKVTLTTANGTQTIFIGSSSGAKATHIRLDGTPETYLTDKLSSYDVPADASGWVKSDFYTVDKNAVTAITVDNKTGSLHFTKDADGTWTLDGLAADEELDTGKVNGLVNNATKINLNAPIGKTADPALGLDDPAATVTVTVKPESGAEETVTLTFGARNDNNQYALKTSTSDYLVYISGFVGDTFAGKTRADFIKQPPTPTPDAAGNSN